MNTSTSAPRLLALSLLVTVIAAGAARVVFAASTRITDPEQVRKENSPPKNFKTKAGFLVKELDLKPDDVVVDIGAGDGYWSQIMAKYVGPGGVIHAAEVDQAKVDAMKKRFEGMPQIKPYLCPLDGPGLPPGSCDLAFISETYHHFEQGTQVAYLRGLRSVLKPSGRIFIVERYIEADLGYGVHGTRLSRLVREAEEAGWVPRRIEMISGTYHYIAILAQKELFPPEPARQDGPKKKAEAREPGSAGTDAAVK